MESQLIPSSGKSSSASGTVLGRKLSPRRSSLTPARYKHTFIYLHFLVHRLNILNTFLSSPCLTDTISTMPLTSERRQQSTLVETPRTVQKGPQTFHGLIWPILNPALIEPLYQIPSQTKPKIKGRCSRHQRAFQISRNNISNLLQYKLCSFETPHPMCNFPPRYSIVQSTAVNQRCSQSFASSVPSPNSCSNPCQHKLSSLESVHPLCNSPPRFMIVQFTAINQTYSPSSASSVLAPRQPGLTLAVWHPPNLAAQCGTAPLLGRRWMLETWLTILARCQCCDFVLASV